MEFRNLPRICKSAIGKKAVPKAGRRILWDGWQQRTLHPTTQPATLHVTVQTDAGSCALQIESADGEILFEQEDLPTSAFDVEVPGDVVVRFTAGRHKGGFSAEILE